jgi:hypothetical protein
MASQICREGQFWAGAYVYVRDQGAAEPRLRNSRSGGVGRGNTHSGGVEDIVLDFGLAPLRGDFLAVPEERDSGGVANPYINFL